MRVTARASRFGKPDKEDMAPFVATYGQTVADILGKHRLELEADNRTPAAQPPAKPALLERRSLDALPR
jgi:hypothetical protein